MTMILLKAHNKGYVKKDGTVVKPFEDKRPAQSSLFGGSKKPKLNPDGHHKPVDIPSHGYDKPKSSPSLYSSPWGFGLFGFSGGKKAEKIYPNAINHPAKNDKGHIVKINEPSEASGPETWTDPDAQAVFVPGGDAPAELNGVALEAWADHPDTIDDWDYVDGQMEDLDEPALHLPLGLKAASGCVIEEPDGRVWLVSPSNGFGGYDTTYPKGKEEEGLSLQANAIKECFEESGLKVEITGFLGDFKRSSSVTRLYTARRVGGSPVAVGWESQAVRLVPRAMLDDVAEHKNDAAINDLLKT